MCLLGPPYGLLAHAKVAALNRQVIDLPLLRRLLHDVLLDRRLRHEAVDVHLPSLADAVRAVLGLRGRERGGDTIGGEGSEKVGAGERLTVQRGYKCKRKRGERKRNNSYQREKHG